MKGIESSSVSFLYLSNQGLMEIVSVRTENNSFYHRGMGVRFTGSTHFGLGFV